MELDRLKELKGWEDLTPLQRQVIGCSCLCKDGSVKLGLDVALAIKDAFEGAGIPTPLEFLVEIAQEEGEGRPSISLEPLRARAF